MSVDSVMMSGSQAAWYASDYGTNSGGRSWMSRRWVASGTKRLFSMPLGVIYHWHNEFNDASMGCSHGQCSIEGPSTSHVCSFSLAQHSRIGAWCAHVSHPFGVSWHHAATWQGILNKSSRASDQIQSGSSQKAADGHWSHNQAFSIAWCFRPKSRSSTCIDQHANTRLKCWLETVTTIIIIIIIIMMMMMMITVNINNRSKNNVNKHMMMILLAVLCNTRCS